MAMNISNKLRHVFYKNASRLRPIASRAVGVQACDLADDHVDNTVLTPKERLKLLEPGEVDSFLDKLKIPYKMQHHEEAAREFLHHRLATELKQDLAELSADQYECLLDDVHDPGERDRLREDINDVLGYYNLVLRQSLFCPQEITLPDMKRMLFNYHSLSARIRYLNYIFIKEFDIWRLAKKELQRKEEKAKREAEEMFEEVGCFDEHGQLQYGYWRNTLFSRYWEKTIQQYSLHKLRQVGAHFDDDIVLTFVSFTGRTIRAAFGGGL